MLDICLLGTGGMQPLPYRWLTSMMARCDGSYLLIEDSGEVTLFGEAYCIQDGEIEQISELGDVVQIDPCDEAWEGDMEEEAEWDS